MATTKSTKTTAVSSTVKKPARSVKRVAAKAKAVKSVSPKTAAKKTAQVKLPDSINQLPVYLKKTSLSYLSALRENARPSFEVLKNYRPSRQVYTALVIAGVILLAVYNKSVFVAATVNGSPLSNLELQNRLNREYREQTLNQMVNEKIVLDEAKKKGIAVSGTDVNNKVAGLEKSVGGAATLDSLLAQQGQTRASLKEQILIQLTIEKMYGSEATVSADEIQQFIDQNKDSLQATTPAEQQKEAEDALKQQKLTQIFQQKFQQLKQAAKIQIF